MNLRKYIFEQYNKFTLAECKEEKDQLRSEIKEILAEHSNLDSNCYQILGLIEYESDDWKKNIQCSIKNFKKAIELDETNVLAQLYLAHCYHDLHQLELALENYTKVDKQKLKKFQVWRYTKLIEQIGYCKYKLGNKNIGEKHFEEVLELHKKLPETEKAFPSELLECLPENHWIAIEMKKITPYIES
ncbi:tetratricopeptide repeat protein [Kordia jejudonensis]|uniref:tetratricopeptide repeat protein n=1 Tax=Kordia jejudonensis TaxID=1348245 RepID=UPI000629730A|nr:hypothetical protein [Kordia jejudonensis]